MGRCAQALGSGRPLVARARVATVVCAVALFAGACGGGADKSNARDEREPTLPARIRKAGAITVGADIEFPPLEFYAEGSSTPEGFDVDLAKALARKLGVRAAFVNFSDLDGLLPALVAGRFDVVMSGIGDTPERRKLGVTFVDYLMAGASIVVPKRNPRAVQSLDDLCGQVVAVQRDTEQDTQTVPDQSARCRVLGRAEVNVIALDSEAGALERLRDGRVAAVLVDSAVAGYLAKTGAEFDAIGPPSGGANYGIAVANRDTDLRVALVDALVAVMADGTYRALVEKWGLTRAALDAAAVNGRRVVPLGGRAPVRPRCCA